MLLELAAVAFTKPREPDAEPVPLTTVPVDIDDALRYVAHVNYDAHPYYADARLKFIPAR